MKALTEFSELYRTYTDYGLQIQLHTPGYNPGVYFLYYKEENSMINYMEEIAKINAAMDKLVEDAIKEAHADLDKFEEEIKLIEQGYTAEEVLNR